MLAAKFGSSVLSASHPDNARDCLGDFEELFVRLGAVRYLRLHFPPILQGRLTVENEGNQFKAPTESFPTHELPAIAVSLDC